MGLASGQWWRDIDLEVNWSILLLPCWEAPLRGSVGGKWPYVWLDSWELMHPRNKHFIFIFNDIFNRGISEFPTSSHALNWMAFGWHLLGHGNLLQCIGCKLDWSRNFCLHLFTIWEKWAGNGWGLKLNCCTYILVMFWFFERRKDMWSTILHQVTKSGTENIGKYLFWHLKVDIHRCLISN